ncbi:MAG: NADH-quinone oxidoreductase subunit L [Bacteroidota bacterium]
MMNYFWLIPVCPLVGFLLIAFNFKRFKGVYSGIIASLFVFASFVLSVIFFIDILVHKQSHTIELFQWIHFNNFSVSFLFLLDQLSALMLLIITGVGFLIHVYSIGYMKGDMSFNRFFSYMNLFVFFMLLLVMGSNYLIMFIGWEGVGLCSYLLIGFWFKNQDYNNAAKKAFIMNRIGDLGFLLGIFMIFGRFGTLDFTMIFSQSQFCLVGDTNITIITILLFVGAIGKSAQIPLFTWLPDAMAGPTPVSALIHAATMVTAGIYMVARSNILYALSPVTLLLISIIGISTALLAGVIAIFQNDIKKILAYSTISQLGFMFLALSVGAFSGAMFHLTTHAFFKALLFLAAGSIIHALHGEQDIRKMGGLKNKIPITFFAFLMGALAISGIPPWSGFFSKDMILLNVFHSGLILWIVGVLIALLTTIYIFRLLFIVFWGKLSYAIQPEIRIHESPKSMTIPMIALAILSLFGGFIGIPIIFGGRNAIVDFLNPVFSQSIALLNQNTVGISTNTELVLMIIPLILILCIALVIYLTIAKRNRLPRSEIQKLGIIKRIAYNKFYIDEIYNWLFVKPLSRISRFMYDEVEVRIIDNFIKKTGYFVVWTGKTIRYIQTGNAGFYLFAMVLSIIIILLLNLF